MVPLAGLAASEPHSTGEHWSVAAIARAEGVHVPSPPRASLEPGDKIDEPEDTGPRDPDATPEGAWQSDGSWGSRALDEEDEQLFRSVEGQAASDKEEEEEEKWREVERPAAQAEARPLGCGSRCDDQTARKLLMYLGRCGDAEHTCTPGELEAHVARLLEHLDIQGCDGKSLGPCAEEAELQQKVAENEHLRLELQMVETERVRLSLLEEKLVDVLQLLQRLRDLRGDWAPWPSWTPCTKPWLAVSSCRQLLWGPAAQRLHSPTRSSSPAEVADPAQPPWGSGSLRIILVTVRLLSPASLTSTIRTPRLASGSFPSLNSYGPHFLPPGYIRALLLLDQPAPDAASLASEQKEHFPA
ncbi:Coiled-coil domain-containing protein 48 [Heterocephalus glaber]|uniref:Coiled-coil domain-containing protein 48 n=1 Tax=Heterocephalus glaber TaxID=10181 RepID=G5AN70_HETGA|nr:Coiled-coil domain-containing protein 48 [Heterocephalus glaber]